MQAYPSSSQSRQNVWRPSVHFGSLEALLTFLARHEVQEICMKSIISPTIQVAGESVRYHAVALSACIYRKQDAPIAYATFMAASMSQIGRRLKMQYPKLAPSDPLLVQPAVEVVWMLHQSLYTALHSALLQQKILAPLTLVEDGLWEVPNVWSGTAKGFAWEQGVWHQVKLPASSVFTLP